MDIKISKSDSSGLYNFNITPPLSSFMFSGSVGREDLKSVFLQIAELVPGLLYLLIERDDEVYKTPIRALGMFCDRNIQLLLREVQAQTLAKVLWFLQDPAVEQAIEKNMTKRAWGYLKEDLDYEQHKCGNPAVSPSDHLIEAKQACLEVIKVIRDLQLKPIKANSP
jgi:hypothetical protein